MTFTQKLQQHKNLFDSLTTRKYDKKSMPEVLAYLKAEKEKNNGNTVYNQQLTDYIAKLHNVPTELIDHLNTEVYLAQHDYTEELDNIKKQKMIDSGYIPLDRHTTYRGKIELVAIKNTDFFTNNIATPATLKELSNNTLFVVPKGRRSKGWYVENLENAFYKPLNK